jgi:hypothetical protein
MIIPKQPFAFHSDSWIRATTSDYRTVRIQMCRTYVCSATTWLYSCSLCGTYSRTSVHVRKTKLRVLRGYVHSSGQSVTRLTAYHNLRHVASTFKHLTTTTTHCDLINFYPHRWGNLPSHDTTHDPVHRPYSDCRIVNIQFLYRASGRKSLDFCRSY